MPEYSTLKEMRSRGMTMDEIGSKVGISKQRVSQLLQRGGDPEHHNRPRTFDYDEVRRRWIEGESFKVIAEDIGVSREAVRSAVRRSS